MKSHKFIAKFMIAAFVACIVGACTDLAKIEDRLDDLDSKVTALQAQISALNNNVETFKYLKAEQRTKNQESRPISIV